MLINTFHITSVLDAMPILQICVDSLGIPEDAGICHTAGATHSFLVVQWPLVGSNYICITLRMSHLDGEFAFQLERTPRNPNSYGVDILGIGTFFPGVLNGRAMDCRAPLAKWRPYLAYVAPMREWELFDILSTFVRTDARC